MRKDLLAPCPPASQPLPFPVLQLYVTCNASGIINFSNPSLWVAQLQLCGIDTNACNNLEAGYNPSFPLCNGVGSSNVNCYLPTPTVSQTSFPQGWSAAFYYA